MAPLNKTPIQALARPIHPEDLAFLAGTMCVATVLAALNSLQAGIAVAYHGGEPPWVGILLARFTSCFAYAVFMPLLWQLVRRRPIEAKRLAASLSFYLLVAASIAVAKEAICVSIGNLFRPGVFVLSQILAEDFSSELLTVFGMVALAHALAFHAGLRSKPEPAVDAYLTVSAEGVVQRVWLRDIECIEAQGNYALLTTASGRKLIRETMGRLLSRLDGRFLRVHRSHIVNVDKVVRAEPRTHSEYWLVLTSGARVPTSRLYKDSVRRLLR